MDEIRILALAFATGILLGSFFFGGLWWTVKRGVVSKRPALWFFGSLIVRMGITLVGFYLITQGHWERTILCLVGFMVARVLVTRVTQTAATNRISAGKEANHEN